MKIYVYSNIELYLIIRMYLIIPSMFNLQLTSVIFKNNKILLRWKLFKKINNKTLFKIKIYKSTPILTTNVLNQIAHVFDYGFWAHGFGPMVFSIFFHEKVLGSLFWTHGFDPSQLLVNLGLRWIYVGLLICSEVT